MTPDRRPTVMGAAVPVLTPAAIVGARARRPVRDASRRYARGAKGRPAPPPRERARGERAPCVERERRDPPTRSGGRRHVPRALRSGDAALDGGAGRRAGRADRVIAAVVDRSTRAVPHAP